MKLVSFYYLKDPQPSTTFRPALLIGLKFTGGDHRPWLQSGAVWEGRIGRATRLGRLGRRPGGAAGGAGAGIRGGSRRPGGSGGGRPVRRPSPGRNSGGIAATRAGRPTPRKRRARPAWIRPAVRVPGGRQGAGSARPGTRAGSA